MYSTGIAASSRQEVQAPAAVGGVVAHILKTNPAQKRAGIPATKMKSPAMAAGVHTRSEPAIDDDGLHAQFSSVPGNSFPAKTNHPNAAHFSGPSLRNRQFTSGRFRPTRFFRRTALSNSPPFRRIPPRALAVRALSRLLHRPLLPLMPAPLTLPGRLYAHHRNPSKKEPSPAHLHHFS
jgi:hypothetical protein